MSQPHHEIDRLVREAIGELRGTKIEKPWVAGVVASTPPVANSLTLTDKVISLAGLNGQLKTIERLFVRPDAIVTPALRDELRARGIAIERTAIHGKTKVIQPTEGLALAAVDTDFAPAEMLRTLNQTGLTAQTIEPMNLIETIHRLATLLASPTNRAVLFTSRPAAAICLANRRSEVRAALAYSAAAVDEAIKQIGANLLVVRPAEHSRHQLRRLVIAYARSPRGECPAELRR
jgi:hypothetical protein